MTKKHLWALWLSLVPAAASAQHLLGISNSNYAGTNALYMNPAHLADNRYNVYVNLGGFQGNVSNNAVYYKGDNLLTLAQNGNIDKLGAQNFVAYGGSSKKLIQAQFQVRTPLSFMVQLSPKHGFALTSRARMMMSGNQISQTLVDVANTPALNTSDYTDRPLNDLNFNLNANLFAEVALSYGRVAINRQKHFLKWGVTTKYLKGAGGYAYVKDLNFLIQTNQPVPGSATSLQEIFKIDKVDIAAGSSVANLKGGDVFQEAMKSAGGFGADIGVVYEFRPQYENYTYTMNGEAGKEDRRANKYKLRVGASLMDLGGIRFKNSSTAGVAFSVTKNDLDQKERDRINGEDFFNADSLRKSFGVNIDKISQYYAGLPTALHITADYQVAPHFYANLTYIQNLRGKFAVGGRYASLLAVTPRVEFHGFEFGLPISLQNNFSNLSIGAAVKLGYMFIGSDNLSGVLNTGKVNGVDIYFGFCVPVRAPKKPKDTDADGISDKLDECKEVPGVWEFKGCPDADGDKIQDKDDECPTEAGLPDFKGCPDRDGDKIPDKLDSCPDVAGLPEFKGCPDRDGDRVEDKEDECPDVAGKVEFKGCPDTDGDGIQDKEDDCPQVAGKAEFKGCPDTDGDGIQDKEDACPEAAGLPQFKGCPDTDADGIMDKEDACPTVVGVRENNGCPPAKGHEPTLTEDEKDVLKDVFEDLEFEYNKAVIAQKSEESLRELAKILKKKSYYKLHISGHTDNVGNPQTNLKLSQERAKAVKAFLEKEGVEAAQLKAEGFGDKKPIADNKTDEGRKKNRRVEFKIVK